MENVFRNKFENYILTKVNEKFFKDLCHNKQNTQFILYIFESTLNLFKKE